MSDKQCHTNLLQWLDGKDEQFSAVYDHYHPKVYRYALRYLKNNTGAEEVAAEVMIKIWEKRNFVNADTFENYLFTIARNKVITEWRKTMIKLAPINLAETLSSPESGYSDHKELEHIYHNTLLELSPRRRKIFLMHREQQLTYKEIAARLNISPKTVENQLSSALKQLRVQLAHLFYNLF